MSVTPRLALAAAALLLSVGAQAQTVMKPGGWRMDSQVSMRDGEGPSKDMGRQSMSVCLTTETLAREPYLSANVDKDKAAARGATCTTSDYRRDGDAASWTMQCTLADGSTSNARISNKASAEELSIELVQDVKRGDGQATVSIRGTGRYIGECTPEMAKP